MAVVPEAAKPKTAQENKGAGWLLGGLSLMGTVAALVGIGTGELPQMVRNHPVLTVAALVCVILAVAHGFTAGYVVSASDPSAERRLLSRGLVLLVAGLFAVVLAGVLTWRDRPEPNVTAEVVQAETGTRVKVTVKARAVPADEDLTVAVHPLTRRATAERQPFRLHAPIHSASLGPDAAGDIAYSTELPVSEGEYTHVEARAWVGEEPKHCYVRQGKTGCVTVDLSRVPEEPQLSTGWRDAGNARKGLSVKVSARDVRKQVMAVRVDGRWGKRRISIARMHAVPDASGRVERSLTLPVDPRVSHVCIAASTRQLNPACPPRRGPGTVWTRLRAPTPAAR